MCLVFSCYGTGLPKGDLEVGGHPAHLPRAGVGLLSLRSRGESTHPQSRGGQQGGRRPRAPHLGRALLQGDSVPTRTSEIKNQQRVPPTSTFPAPLAASRVAKPQTCPVPPVSLSLSEGSLAPHPHPTATLHPSQVSCRAHRLTRWASCGGSSGAQPGPSALLLTHTSPRLPCSDSLGHDLPLPSTLQTPNPPHTPHPRLRHRPLGDCARAPGSDTRTFTGATTRKPILGFSHFIL